ncbi:type III-A CRISPR-associated RAMP protein Csm5 [Thermosipho globiformans]|uniref:type III-A CRISPR-associated RAMP protein Csm5 n=1 Tax=Thermosipho globiformans TaxID=380685 RepID=UPI000F8C54E9|nr:type III-A CRISPR-associated RAMP protein Csm5 [Thermosipho globiformans]
MKIKAYKYKIEVVTPVAILSGEKIQRFEIVKDGNRTFVLDFERMIRNEQGFVDILIKNPLLFQNPEEILNIFRRFNINYKNYIKYEINDYMRKNYEINEFIKSNGKPYIPGSSIKGAMRTNIIRGSKFCGNYIREVNSAIKNNNYRINSSKIEKNFLGDSYKSPFKFLRVSDTNLLEKKFLRVKPIEIYNLKTKRKVMNILYSEVLPEKTVLHGEINLGFYDYLLDFPFKDEYMNLDILEDFILKLKSGVEKYINDEISIMKENHEKGLLDFYRSLQSYKLKENQVLLPLGFSTGFYSKTLVGKLRREHVIYLKKVLGRRAIKYDPSLFPKTRRIINDGGAMKPLGWILMTITEK